MLFHIDPLRLWVHKVLPVVYDDSLSYYEVLAKVTKKLNEVIDLTEEQNQYIEEFSTNLTNAINHWEDGMEQEWSSYKSGLNNEWANFQKNTEQYIENWKNMAESDIEDAIAAGINQFVSYFSDLTETAVHAAEEAMAAAENAAQDAVDAVMPTLESEFDERYAWKTAVGSPLVATTAAGMTDTTKVYVYAGSETGYVNGDWYYYDGTAWQDGGVYNSAAVVTDPTLSESGVPADAKAAGDEIADLKSALCDVSGNVLFEYTKDKSVSNSDIPNQTTESGWESVVVTCQEGDVFNVKGAGGNSTRLWMFAKSDGTIITQSAGGLTANNFATIIAPENAHYLCCNSHYTVNKGVLIGDTLVRNDTNFIKEEIEHIENSIFKKYTMDDLSETGTYIDSDGTIKTTTLSLATSPMIPVEILKEIVLHKNSQTMTAYSIGFYNNNQFDSHSFISGYVADFAEGTVSVTPPSGTKYIAFCSRTNVGYVFDVSLVYAVIDALSNIKEETEQNTESILSSENDISVLSDFVCEEEAFINKPDSTISTTNPSNIFGIGKILYQGYYTAKFYTSQPATLYIFAVDNLADTSLVLKSKVTKEPQNGAVTFDTFKIDETCIIGLTGSIGYKATPSSPYYLITYSDGAYTKPSTESGNVVFNIEVNRIVPKVNNSVEHGIGYIAQTVDAVHIKLIGDSITQGSGSTGYIEFTADGLVYRGNAPGYPGAGADYQVGEYLGSSGSIRWYEALDGSGWGQLIKAYFEEKFNCTVKDYGMGGATTQDIITQWDNIVDADDDIVIVMIGTNDRRSLSLNTYYNNLTTIVSNLQAMGKKVIVMSPPPILPSVDANSQYFHMEDACNNSSAVAYNKGCQFIDNFGYIEEYCELKGVGLNTLLNNDGVHPNDTGYRVLFNNIVKELGIGRKVDGATW